MKKNIIDKLSSFIKSAKQSKPIYDPQFAMAGMNNMFSAVPDPDDHAVERPMDVHELGHLASKSEEREPADLNMLLKVSEGFIDFCLADGEESSEQVTKSLVSMQQAINAAQEELNAVARVGASAKINNNIQVNLARAFSELEQVIVAMQFYDRISQRLNHAAGLLRNAREIDSAAQTADAKLDKLHAGLAMEDERVLVSAIREGASIPYAVKSAHKAFHDQASNQDIELF